MNQFDIQVEKILSPFKSDKLPMEMFMAFVHLFIILYAVKIAPELPPTILHIFENIFFKITVFFVIIYLAKYKPSIALLVSIAFMISVNFANTESFLEKMTEEIIDESVPVPFESEHLNEKKDIAEVSEIIQEENPISGCFDNRTIDMENVFPLDDEQLSPF